MSHSNELDVAVSGLLARANEAGSPNHLATSRVRSWLREFLQDLADEGASPEEVHWNLLLADKSDARDGVFLLVVLDGVQAQFAAGRGRAAAVREFSLRGFPENLRHLVADATARFQVQPPVTTTRSELEEWLAASSRE